MIVVDASLATKWRLEEPDSPAALVFLERYRDRVCGPDFLAIEVCRAIVTAANIKRTDASAAEVLVAGWLRSIENGKLPLYPLNVHLLRRATNIALEIGHPLADCLYLALAIDRAIDLVTCDVRFATKARARYSNVRLLADYA